MVSLSAQAVATQAVADARTVGTPSAVAELYLAGASDVRRLVAHAVHARETHVEDACQVAWARLMAHRCHVQRRAAIAWVVRTAIHEMCRSLRRDRPLVAMSELADEAGEYPTLGLTAPLDELVEERSRLWVLDALPVRQRKLLWLRAFGFSYDEVAAEAGMSLRAVERQLQRARRRLLADAQPDPGV